MPQPRTDRRGAPRGALLLLLAAGALLPLAACASTPEEAPAPELDVRAPVSADALARKLDLSAPRRIAEGGIVLEAGRDERIALFPGTHVASVRGVRYQTDSRIETRDDAVWLSAHDADVLERIWQQGLRPGASRSPLGSFGGSAGGSPVATAGGDAPLTMDDLPPAPLPTSAAADVAGPAIPAASPAERRAWSVPLRRPWQYIVVHHSATPAGNATVFNKAHLARGWDGLGYHFVIGNGNESPDGRIEVGFRWSRQREGAHAGNDLMNQRGIGICLVGDFSKSSPTPAQMRSLRRLCDFLSAYCNIPAGNLRLHRDFRDTECPGRNFPRSFALRPPASIRGAAHVHDGR